MHVCAHLCTIHLYGIVKKVVVSFVFQTTNPMPKVFKSALRVFITYHPIKTESFQPEREEIFHYDFIYAKHSLA